MDSNLKASLFISALCVLAVLCVVTVAVLAHEGERHNRPRFAQTIVSLF